MTFGLLLFSLVLLFTASLAQYDVVVYGGPPGGVMAAVSAARNGQNVALLEPYHFVGGMSSNGLGKTDTGQTNVIGGLAREFFTRNGQYYGSSSPQWNLEPHVARDIFMQMLNESKVAVILNSGFVNSVSKTGTVINSITLTNGKQYTGKIFIDASYEGDLLARAGVSYTYGRESNTTYNESLAGRQYYSPGNQFSVRVDPYEDDGTTLLPLMYGGDPGVPGQGDQKIEAYNFRMCFTQNKSNLIPITQPAGYDPHMYELPRRYGQALGTPSLSSFLGNTQPVPNSKYDVNNGGPMSTDLIGGSWDYPEANYSLRSEIWWRHYNYTAGFFWFLGHDANLSETVKNSMLSYGLCADEFVDSDPPYWPEQLYVREARRMKGDFIFIQQSATSHPNLGNSSIGMGSYNFDSHHVQRIPCANSTFHCEPNTTLIKGDASDYYALNEGDVQVNPGEYEIPLDIILPSRKEATNLLVPVAVSASHIGFCTIRLEPTWMIVGHSAGTAAAIAISSGVSAVQDVDRGKLYAQLLNEKQILYL